MRFWETPKYNSQELDKETGYYFYNARHYDAGISRFVTPDTVIDGEMSTQGWNRYAYVHNNPIRYKDPTGHRAMVLNSDAGAGGVGHSGALVQNSETGNWEYFSRQTKKTSGSDLGTPNAKGIPFKSPEAFFQKQYDSAQKLNSIKDDPSKSKEYNALQKKYADYVTYDKDKGSWKSRYNAGTELNTTKGQDKVLKDYLTGHIDDQYLFLGNNCKDLISRGLNKAGVKNSTNILEDPDSWYEGVKNATKGTELFRRELPRTGDLIKI